MVEWYAGKQEFDREGIAEHVEVAHHAGARSNPAAPPSRRACNRLPTICRPSSSRSSAWLEEQALEIYYTAEALARDAEHADLIPVVERLRQAYQHDHGRAIPPRKKA